VDVLRIPVIGALLRWRHVRAACQLVLLAIAGAVVLHGLFGPQLAPLNLATVLTSIHWRGLLVGAVLVLGNLFCTACPMILVRDAGRRLFPARRSWPRFLRRKWLALGLLVAVLFSYELFNLWELPRATAWLVLGYFGLAVAVDLTFRGASFCKYVCPIGQFNFIASTIAPTTLQVRNIETCRSCRTSDCIKGRYMVAEPVRLVQRGCELGLFLPTKVGNLECTLCLDCVHACPHDNIGLVARVPGAELLETRRRSVIGRLGQRSDIAALAIIFTFAALLNAFAMTAPAHALERWLGGGVNRSSEAIVLTLLFVVALVVLPAILLPLAGSATRASAGTSAGGLGATIVTFAPVVVPLGLGVWLAHYGFHFMSGMLTVVPVTQSAAIDLLGSAALGEPAWSWAGMQPGSVYPIQLGFVLLGAAGSIDLARAMSARDYPARPVAASLSWVCLILLLAAIALWILSQPMEMRAVGR
jgi:polyferredoxin